MPDTYDSGTRSRVMRQVKAGNTAPELLLRKALIASGVRGYRLHRKDIVGKPDLAFIGKRVAIFVDGAWWHGHPSKWWKGRSGQYWDKKIETNVARDARVDEQLQSLGWTVLRFWDFEVTKETGACVERVKRALDRVGRNEG